MSRHRVEQRRKILALSLAAEDQNHLPVGAEAGQRGHGGPHVRALAVVKVLDVLHHAEGFDTMGLAAVLAQAEQHRRQAAPRSPAQRQRRQRVQGVVPATDAQGVGGHEPLNVKLVRVFVATAAGFVGFVRPNQPRHAIDDLDAVVARPFRHAGAKGHHTALLRFLQASPARRRPHGHHARIVTVEHHQALSTEHLGLGRRISGHAAMPVQVVLGQVEHRGSRRLEGVTAVELKTRQFQHPDVGQGVRVEAGGQRIQQGRADVARYNHGLARPLHELPSQCGHGGLPVCPGDAEHLRVIVAVLS